MAILQENKRKVQPVMDYRELNEHLDEYRAGVDVCAQKLTEWQLQRSNAALLDLLIHVDKSLWPFQTVNGAKILSHPLGIWAERGTTKHAVHRQNRGRTGWSCQQRQLDDIFINESVCLAAHVKAHLEQFGLTSKDLEPLRNGTRELGLHV